jgi:hypothetical protein
MSIVADVAEATPHELQRQPKQQCKHRGPRQQWLDQKVRGKVSGSGQSGLHFCVLSHAYQASLARRNRSAFVTTDTELNAIAAPANIGESRIPKAGYSTPAARGMPRAL